jgi:hypothetical protein
MRKLGLPPFSDGLPELAAEVAEEGKGLRRIPSSPMKSSGIWGNSR